MSATFEASATTHTCELTRRLSDSTMTLVLIRFTQHGSPIPSGGHCSSVCGELEVEGENGVDGKKL